MQHSTSRSSSGSAQPVSSPPPYTVNPLATGTRGSSSTGTQLLPPLLAQMARQFNIPEATVNIARRGSEANLVLSTLALSFQEMQAEMEQLRAENAQLRRDGPDEVAGSGCMLMDLHGSGRNSASDECTTALLHTAQNGDNMFLMELLLSHAEVDVNAGNETRRTPLHCAAAKGYEPVVRRLIQHPRINDINPRNTHGSTPLLLAAEYGHVEVVRTLLEHGDVDLNAQDNDGDFPLNCAAAGGHISVLRLLLEHSADTVNVNLPDNNGRTPLSWAADAHINRSWRSNYPRKEEATAYALVKLLLQQNEIDINRSDARGKTPLTYALASGFGNVCRLLRASGAR